MLLLFSSLLTAVLTFSAASGHAVDSNPNNLDSQHTKGRVAPSKCVHENVYDDLKHGLTLSSHNRAQVAFADTSNSESEDFAGVPIPPLEVIPLGVSGPSSNRVDLVFFADGYLEEERDKFYEDATRLADDISGNQTFNTVKPLMNFWAAFTASNESGVGVGGKPLDTPFGLYRDGTELRAVFYAHPKVAGAACKSLGNQCDYPILLGNDPLYGGLGGKFTVITPSLANGALILRHELGHSIIKVGEEYDGGYAYVGVDAHKNLSEPVPWAHWLTNSSDHSTKDEVRVERAVMPMQEYPWTLLNTSAPWAVDFQSSGSYTRHLVRFSLSGMPAAADLKVELDGEDLQWAPRVNIGKDRWHYDVYQDGGLPAGNHRLSFTLLEEKRVGEAQVCSAEVLEFGDEDEFVSTPGHYSLYPTFSFTNETSYRPTNEDCLMRQVTTPNFCKACIEGLWLALLRDVNLIDGIEETCIESSAKSALTLHLVPLAQFRTFAVSGLDESYRVTWSKDGVEVPELVNQTQVEVGEGVYGVEVQYKTSEVRVDKEGLLGAKGKYVVGAKCK
ncbi:IgA peptidase M64-domain-containing protein [Mycena metata]|uniref:IgA peptidase M64-domain-containing protein n=1 Tax=Mycena metata TaxID=1033252 RepID=A0AAD7HSJ6_9AGAR|nr:IgA peptidase M64-domain-containing protein [Mycena metata]